MQDLQTYACSDPTVLSIRLFLDFFFFSFIMLKLWKKKLARDVIVKNKDMKVPFMYIFVLY